MPINSIHQNVADKITDQIVSHLTRIDPALAATFVALPSDPAVPLTPEQLAAMFGAPRETRIRIVHEILLRLAAEGGDHVR